MKSISFLKKIVLIKRLFLPNLIDKNNQLIDNNTYYNACAMTRDYLTGIYKITKNDLIYINCVINKLINILSLDENKITKEYIETKLFIYDTSDRYFRSKKPFKPTIEWINDYKLIICDINNRKLNIRN